MKINGTRILCAVFGIYLTLATFLPQGAVLLEGYLCNGEALNSRLCTEEAAVTAHKGILAECETVADPCGLPYSVYDGVFTDDVIHRHMKEAVTAATRSEKYAPDLKDMKALLKEQVKDVLREEDGVEDFTEYEEDIDAFCSQSLRIYKSYVNLSVYSKIDNLYAMARKILWIGAAVFVLLTAFVCYFLFRLSGSVGEFLREVSFSVLAGGLCNTLLALCLVRTDPLKNLQLSPVYLREGLRRFLADGFRFDLLVGLGTLAVGLLLFAASVAVIRGYNRKLETSEK